jgi:hypothetical protein
MENLDVMEIVATTRPHCHREQTFPTVSRCFLTQVHGKVSLMQGSAGIATGIQVRSICIVLNVIITQCSFPVSTSSQPGYRWKPVSCCFGGWCKGSSGVQTVQPPGVGLAWRKRGSGYYDSNHHDVSGGSIDHGLS